jgi:hypothetical protein
MLIQAMPRFDLFETWGNVARPELAERRLTAFKRETSEADIHFIPMTTATALDAATAAGLRLGS